MKFEIVILGFFLMLLCAGIIALFLKAFYDRQFKKAILFKGIASLCFVAFGAAAFAFNEFSWIRLIVFVGLCFGLIGDEILALCQIYPRSDKQHFIGGGVFFIVGHLAYILSMLLMDGPNLIAAVIAFVALVLLSFAYNKRDKFFVVDVKDSLILYICIVVLFSAVGIATFLKQGTLGSALLALGGIMFVISDNLLFAYKYGVNSKFMQNIVLHVAYYLAQFFIAWSISLI